MVARLYALQLEEVDRVIWTPILADPTVPIDRSTLRMVVDDQRTVDPALALSGRAPGVAWRWSP